VTKTKNRFSEVIIDSTLPCVTILCCGGRLLSEQTERPVNRSLNAFRQNKVTKLGGGSQSVHLLTSTPFFRAAPHRSFTYTSLPSPPHHDSLSIHPPLSSLFWSFSGAGANTCSPHPSVPRSSSLQSYRGSTEAEGEVLSRHSSRSSWPTR